MFTAVSEALEIATAVAVPTTAEASVVVEAV